jgi:aryl-alcohol dehydrogenase-like predicted oxidoreductase
MAEVSVMHRIVMGAAALAQPYGIANPQSSVSPAETDDLLTAAWSRGIRFIDTASTYGEAEIRIGNWSNRTGNHFRIIGKLPIMQDIPNAEIKATVQSHIEATCRSMRIDQLEGYLIHNPADFARPHVREALAELQEKGKFGYYGLSIYQPEDAITALTLNKVGALQIPINVFDNRLFESGLSEKCYNNDIRLFLRSVFLQGLIFRNPDTLPAFFRPIFPKLHAFRSLSKETGVSLSHLALSYVLQTVRSGQVIVGCRQVSHVEELSNFMEGATVNNEVINRMHVLRNEMDVKMIDPRLWPNPS